MANVSPKPTDFGLPTAVLLVVLALAPPLVLAGAAQAEAFVDVAGVASYALAAAGGIARRRLASVFPPFAVMFLLLLGFVSGQRWFPYQRLTVKRTSESGSAVYAGDTLFMGLSTTPDVIADLAVDDSPPYRQ